MSMLKMPLPDIIARITLSTGLSETDINSKINSKLNELSGLISKEGAAHIIANELGVKLFEQTSGKLQIKNILSGMRNVETVGKVTRKFELREFKTETREGKVASMVIGDETGTIRAVMWGTIAENITRINEGDIIKIVGGYVRESQGNKEVHMNDRSKLLINPAGESVGAVIAGGFREARPAATRKSIKDLDENDLNAEILGTIVQVFEPRFFEVCPDCGKRARQEGDNFVCPSHGAVKPSYSYLVNAVVDDGTETIRCTFFRNQAERLLDKTPDGMQLYRESPAHFESVKNELLGNIVKLVGRVNKNEMFDRMEFVPQLVFTNPSPSEEITRLQREISQKKEVKSVSHDEQTEDEYVTEEIEKNN